MTTPIQVRKLQMRLTQLDPQAGVDSLNGRLSKADIESLYKTVSSAALPVLTPTDKLTLSLVYGDLPSLFATIIGSPFFHWSTVELIQKRGIQEGPTSRAFFESQLLNDIRRDYPTSANQGTYTALVTWLAGIYRENKDTHTRKSAVSVAKKLEKIAIRFEKSLR